MGLFIETTIDFLPYLITMQNVTSAITMGTEHVNVEAT
jgi:hypothetical protein